MILVIYNIVSVNCILICFIQTESEMTGLFDSYYGIKETIFNKCTNLKIHYIEGTKLFAHFEFNGKIICSGNNLMKCHWNTSKSKQGYRRYSLTR